MLAANRKIHYFCWWGKDCYSFCSKTVCYVIVHWLYCTVWYDVDRLSNTFFVFIVFIPFGCVHSVVLN